MTLKPWLSDCKRPSLPSVSLQGQSFRSHTASTGRVLKLLVCTLLLLHTAPLSPLGGRVHAAPFSLSRYLLPEDFKIPLKILKTCTVTKSKEPQFQKLCFRKTHKLENPLADHKGASTGLEATRMLTGSGRGALLLLGQKGASGSSRLECKAKPLETTRDVTLFPPLKHRRRRTTSP